VANFHGPHQRRSRGKVGPDACLNAGLFSPSPNQQRAFVDVAAQIAPTHPSGLVLLAVVKGPAATGPTRDARWRAGLQQSCSSPMAVFDVLNLLFLLCRRFWLDTR